MSNWKKYQEAPSYNYAIQFTEDTWQEVEEIIRTPILPTMEGAYFLNHKSQEVYFKFGSYILQGSSGFAADYYSLTKNYFESMFIEVPNDQ